MQEDKEQNVGVLSGQEETIDVGTTEGISGLEHRDRRPEDGVGKVGGPFSQTDGEYSSSRLIGFWTLLKREIIRFLSLPNQTLVPPFISALLYIAIFGYSIGSRISSIEGVTYLQYIFPGLMMMGVINSAYMNTSSSLFMSKFQGNIADILTSPLSYFEMVTAMVLGGMIRGLIVGVITMLTGLMLMDINIENYFLVGFFMLFVSTIFAQLGLITGLIAEKFEHLGIFQTYMITPLVYLGGVFYSTSMLPPFWAKLSLFNPILYMVNGLRYGMLGIGDINLNTAMITVVVSSIILGAINLYLFKIGYKLRT